MSNLILRTVLGFAFLMLVLALALFIPAGSLAFWQAWVYLAIFAGCTLLITLYLARYDPSLLAGRVQAGPLAETQRSQQIIQSLASLFFVLLYIVAGLDFRFGWTTLPPVVSLVADGFVILGFGIVFLVFRENRFTRATIGVTVEQTVVTSGPYRVVRHPMYAGALVMLLATPLALGSWMALPFPLPLIVVIAVRARAEERFLTASLAGYAQYCQQVRYRLAPYIW